MDATDPGRTVGQRKFQKKFGRPRKRFQVFSLNSLESTAAPPAPYKFKALEASRAFPEFSPPQYGRDASFIRSGSGDGSNCCHGILNGTEGISEKNGDKYWKHGSSPGMFHPKLRGRLDLSGSCSLTGIASDLASRVLALQAKAQRESESQAYRIA